MNEEIKKMLEGKNGGVSPYDQRQLVSLALSCQKTATTIVEQSTFGGTPQEIEEEIDRITHNRVKKIIQNYWI